MSHCGRNPLENHWTKPVQEIRGGPVIKGKHDGLNFLQKDRRILGQRWFTKVKLNSKKKALLVVVTGQTTRGRKRVRVGVPSDEKKVSQEMHSAAQILSWETVGERWWHRGGWGDFKSVCRDRN